MIQSIEEEKKLIQFKMLEGDLMELYKSFVATFHVENEGEIDLVTLTMEYEMVKEDVEHPISLLSYFIELAKDIETHIAKSWRTPPLLLLNSINRIKRLLYKYVCVFDN